MAEEAEPMAVSEEEQNLMNHLFGEMCEPEDRDGVVDKARDLMDSIVESRGNVSPLMMNELASLLEEEEAKYQQKAGYPYNINSRSSHVIGRLLTLIRDHDDFYEMLSSELVLEGSMVQRAAGARLLLACVVCWTGYTFDDPTLAMLKQLMLEEFDPDNPKSSKAVKPKGVEMLHTYAIGLFAQALTGPEIIEESLTKGLPGRLMRFLRLRVLGDVDMQQQGEPKHTSHKSRDEHRVRHKQPETVDMRPSSDGAGEEPGSMAHEASTVDGDERRKKKDRSARTTAEDSGRAESSRKKTEYRDRSAGRHRGKARAGEGTMENVHAKPNPVESTVDLEKELANAVYMVGRVDISAPTRKAVIAARKEAKEAHASYEAIIAAGEAAAEVVRCAALEAQTEDEENLAAVLAAAEATAEAVSSAAAGVSRKEAERLQKLVEEAQAQAEAVAAPEQEEVDPHVVSPEALAFLKTQFCVQCLDRLGEYLEVLGPILQERGVDVCVLLLRRHSQQDVSSVSDMNMVSDVLKLICALAAHRKFAVMLVDRGGIQELLSAPRIPQTYFGISLCMYAIASLQSVMERVCALSPPVVPDMVALIFQLLESSHDGARKNAALFVGASFVFRPVIESFDNQDGIRKLLNILRNAVSLRSGGGAPASRSESVASREGNLIISRPGIGVFRQGQAEVLTSAEKQVAFHTCVALGQYFRSHFFLLVDSLRPSKGRGAARNSSLRNPCKPIEVGNDSLEAVIQQISRDRKLGAAFLRTKWPAVENFMSHGGHLLMLELAQAAPGEKYLQDIAQYALAVLQIVTLVPSARRVVIGSTISNERSGMAVILDAISGTTSFEPEAVQLALLVLSNLVCPPPAFSSRSGQTSLPASNGHSAELKDRPAKADDKDFDSAAVAPFVGDSRISLGPGLGGPGLAAYMEQGYRLAREAVRANNGIKILLHLLHPKTVLAPSADDCIRALACRVLIGLARDETIAQILTKLQLGKLLSEVLRDGGQAGRQSSAGGDHDRWQAELNQVAVDLMGIVTNAGRANTVASEAAAPTLRRIERATIAAATPINYHSDELLQLIHEHLLTNGLVNTASALLKEAQIASLPSTHSALEAREVQPERQKAEIHWPGSIFMGSQRPGNEEKDKMPVDGSARRRGLTKFVTPRKLQSKDVEDATVPAKGHEEDSVRKVTATSSKLNEEDVARKTLATSSRTVLPAKRKFSEKDGLPLTPGNHKRLHMSDAVGASSSSFSTPQVRFKTGLGALTSAGEAGPTLPHSEMKTGDEPSAEVGMTPYTSHQSALLLMEPKSKNERATLDSLVVQYLKHQHRQCPAPITTLPELSLLHPHVCPEPSRKVYAPYNVTSRLASREILPQFGGLHGRRHNRHFVFSKFRPMRTLRDDAALFTCGTFLGQASSLAMGGHSGHIRLFEISTGNIIEALSAHASTVLSLQSSPIVAGLEGTLLLSSSAFDARLWNSSSMAAGPLNVFDNVRGARFNNAGTMVGALVVENPLKEVRLYDVNTFQQRASLTESSIIGSRQSIVHFSPSDDLVLWNGVLWDHRIPRAIHRFDQFTDYGGGGFHPAGNEVIINSEVWDLRTFKLLRSVPSLDQTVVTFNATGEVMYATLRRTSDDVSTALNTRRARHPLFLAFRTMDAVDYSDIATIQVDRCVLDLAVEPTDSFIAVIAMEAHDMMDAYVRLFEVGRRRPTTDDEDDGVDEDDEDDDDDDEDDEAGNGIPHIPDIPGLISGDDEDDDDDDDDDSESSEESEEDDADGPGGLGFHRPFVDGIITDVEDSVFGTSDEGSGDEFDVFLR